MQISLSVLSYAFYTLLFIVAIFFAFFIPGDLLLKKIKLNGFQRIVMSILLGVGMWIWQGFILGFLNFRIGTYFYLVGFSITWFILNKDGLNRLRKNKIKIKVNYVILVLLLLGVFVQVSAVFTTGIRLQSGLYFCCGNISDSLYHIALSGKLVEQVPPFEPGMSEVLVRNYHYLSNLITADLVRIFHFPLILLQYQLFTIFVSLFLGLSAISFAKSNNLSNKYIYWLLFLLYFSGDFIYVFLILLGKGLSFSMGSLEDGSIFLVNPPRAVAIIMLFGVLSTLSLWVKKKATTALLTIGIIAATIIGLKVYVGIFAMVGLVSVSTYYLLKKDFRFFIALGIALFGVLIFYLPVNSKAGGMYYTGFWLFENFISQPKFDLIRLELARNVYKEHNNYLRLAQYAVMYVAVYFFSIFGIKLLAFFQSRKSLSLIPLPVHIFLLSGILCSAVIGFFFQQESGGSNSFNFIVTIFIMSSIYAALAISYWLSKFPKPLAVLIACFIICLTIPRVVYQVYQNIDWVLNQRGFIISNSQLDALEYLSSRPSDSLVMVHASFSDQDETTPFVSFFTRKPMYLSGKGILDSHAISTQKRNTVKEMIMKSDNPVKVAMTIKNSKIDYILMSDFQELAATQTAVFLDKVLLNDSSKIYHVSDSKLNDFIDKMKYEVK